MRSKYSRAELERRWLVDLTRVEIPLGAVRRQIEDRFILGTNLRLRKVSSSDEVVHKLGQKLDGHVTNIYLSAEEYSVLAALPAKVLRKERVSLAGGALDIPSEPKELEPRWEIEFTSDAEMAEFVPPGFVGEEVFEA